MVLIFITSCQNNGETLKNAYPGNQSVETVKNPPIETSEVPQSPQVLPDEHVGEYRKVDFKGEFDVTSPQSEDFDSLIISHNTASKVFSFKLMNSIEASDSPLVLFPMKGTMSGPSISEVWDKAYAVGERGGYEIEYFLNLNENKDYELTILETRWIDMYESDEVIETKRWYLFQK